jgi:hypothetical protein
MGGGYVDVCCVVSVLELCLYVYVTSPQGNKDAGVLLEIKN